MDHKRLAEILQLIRPGSEYNIRGKEDGTQVIEWLDKNTTQPTEEEIAEADANFPKLNYRSLRASAYPPIEDLADALVHQADGDEAPLKAYLQRCSEVKAQFPKPL